MKATRIVDCIGPNPAWDRTKATRAKALKEPYGVPRDITFDAGTINDHPEVWILCCLPEPKCSPLDDECKRKVDAFLNHPARLAQLQKLKRMAQPEVFAQLPKGLQDYVQVVCSKWIGNSVTDSGITANADKTEPKQNPTPSAPTLKDKKK